VRFAKDLEASIARPDGRPLPQDVRGGALSNGALEAALTDAAGQVKDPMKRNNQHWGVDDGTQWFRAINQIRTFILQRAAWMDSMAAGGEFPRVGALRGDWAPGSRQGEYVYPSVGG